MSDSHGTRTRELPTVESGKYRESITITVNNQSSTSVNTGDYGISGQETTTSRDNPDWKNRRRLLKHFTRDGKALPKHIELILRNTDIGNGNFESVKKYVECSHRHISIFHRSGAYTYTYDGPMPFAWDHTVGPTNSGYPAVPTDLRDRMIALGTTAIARTIPTNPVAGAAQFLGELREGLPSIPGASLVRRGGPGGVADEYINYEFGIKPIISDLRKFGEASRDASKHLDQLHRDSGRLVRRRYSFPAVRRVEDPVVVSTNYPGSPGLRGGPTGPYLSAQGKLTRQRTYEERFWFSGAYTYYVDMGDSARSRLRRTEQDLAKLFGTRLNAELLWELAPWSWLVDWKSNMGDVIHNFSALQSDSLVLRYGYMMAHVVIKDTYLLDGVVLRGGHGGPLSQVFTTEVKKRVKATPYGFGLDPDAFTTRQKAILAALGVSRAAR